MYINIYVCLHVCILYCQLCFTIHDYTAFVSMVLWTPSVSSCQPVRNKSLPWSKVQTQLGHHYASTSEQFFNEANSCNDMNFSGKRWIGLTTFYLLSLELVDCWKKEIAGTWWHLAQVASMDFLYFKGVAERSGLRRFSGPEVLLFTRWTWMDPWEPKGQWGVGVDDLSPSGMDAADLEGLSFQREFAAAWEVCAMISHQFANSFFCFGGSSLFQSYNNQHSLMMFHVHVGLQIISLVSLCAPWYLVYIICPLVQDLQLNWGQSHLFPRCCRLDDLEFTARYVLMWIDMDWYESWRLLGPIGTFAILFQKGCWGAFAQTLGPCVVPLSETEFVVWPMQEIACGFEMDCSSWLFDDRVKGVIYTVYITRSKSSSTLHLSFTI